MKIIKIKGGLGNQLFQYSFAMLMRAMTNENVKIDMSSYDNVIGIDDVMPSGSVNQSMQQLGFDKESIKSKIKNILKK